LAVNNAGIEWALYRGAPSAAALRVRQPGLMAGVWVALIVLAAAAAYLPARGPQACVIEALRHV
jgi:hypothetical protein